MIYYTALYRFCIQISSSGFSVEFFFKVNIFEENVVEAVIFKYFMYVAHLPLFDIGGMGIGNPEKAF